MEIYEIIIVILLILFVLTVFSLEFYKSFIKKESSECSCCKSNMKRAMKDAKKALNKANIKTL